MGKNVGLGQRVQRGGCGAAGTGHRVKGPMGHRKELQWGVTKF